MPDAPPRVRALAEMTWPVAGGAAGSLLAVPLGATEQHGTHLPLGTDTLVAGAVTAGLSALRPEVVVAPALPYGSSGEHSAFPGTLSIGQAGLETLVVELVRSADHYGGTVLVSGHGGNAEPLIRAAATCAKEDRRVLVWWPTNDALSGVVDPGVLAVDAHAGRVETSLLLHLAPDQVGAPSTADPEDHATPRPVAEIMPTLLAHGVGAVSATGVLGDPTGASPEEGAAMLAALVADLDRRVARWLEGAR